MKDLYYGDRRDRVKWGALTFLANRYNVSTILQVAYLREHALISLETDVGPTPIPEAVWRQFSNLRSVETLGSAIGHSIVVIVLALA